MGHNDCHGGYLIRVVDEDIIRVDASGMQWTYVVFRSIPILSHEKMCKIQRHHLPEIRMNMNLG